MKITRKSPRTGLNNTMELPIDDSMLDLWINHGRPIQDAMPDLTAEQREFLITGYTPEDWTAMFPPICDSCEWATINRVNFELRCGAPKSAHHQKIVEPENSCGEWKAS